MKKGFTLIELLAVILLLGIISLITIPIVTRFIDNSKQKAYEQIVKNIEDSAYNYSIYNDLGYSQLYKRLDISEIQDNGYLESKEIIDPRNNEKMDGCVLYRWLPDKNQYEFRYDEECNVENSQPEVTVNVINDNNKEWMTEKLKFEVKGEYDSYKYCIGDQDCEGIKEYNGTTTVDEEGKNIKICVVGYYGEEKGRRTCTKEYNVDTTKPETEITNLSIKTDRAIITASCTDDESGITKYEFYDVINGTWVDKGETNSYTVAGLTQGTSYNFQVKCTNKAGLVETVSSTKSTPKIANPTIEQYSQTPADVTYVNTRVIRITYNGTNVEGPEYYFKSSVSATVSNGVVVSSCGNGITPSACSNGTVTTLVANTWYKTNNTTVDVTYKENGYLYAMAKDSKGNTAEASTYSIINIDVTGPSASVAGVSTKTDRATVTASCSDTESQISKYEFFNPVTNSWISNGTNNSYTITGLNQNTNYKFEVRCTNGAGLSATANKSETTKSISAPNIVQNSQTPTGTTYANTRVIRITYYGTNIESPEYYFKSSVSATVNSGIVVSSCGNSNAPSTCNNGTVTTLAANTWYKTNNTTVDVTYTTNGQLYAMTKDTKGNYVSASTYTISNIDTTGPSASITGLTTTINSATITASCSDTESQISKYEFLNPVTNNWISNGTNNSYTITGLSSSATYNFQVRCTNGVGKTSTATRSGTIGTPTCIAAKTLHTGICNRGDNNGCDGAQHIVLGEYSNLITKYKKGDTITYGKLYSDTNKLESGIAFDCDVNGDGIYNEETERFYYVSDYYNTETGTFDSKYAVLIYYHQLTVYSGEVANTMGDQNYNTDLVSTDSDTFIPKSAAERLPNDTTFLLGGKPYYGEFKGWPNVSLVTTNRQIRTELDSTLLSTSKLLPKYDYSTSGDGPISSRLLTIQELKKGCDIVASGDKSDTIGEDCYYLFEHVDRWLYTTGSYGFWLESHSYNSNSKVWYVRPGNLRLETVSAKEARGVKPVIEVPAANLGFESNYSYPRS